MNSNDTLVRVLVAVVAAIVLIPVLVMLFMMPMMGMWGGHMWGGAAGGGTSVTWMWLAMWFAILAIVAGLGYLLYRAISRPSASKPDSALEELRIAYARGELTDEEFETRRNRLRRE